MRRKNNYLVAVANNGKFRQRFMPGVPRTFDHDCSLRRALFSTEANLFEGQEKNKLPIFNINGIQSNLYYLAGKMAAYLIIHLDIGLPVFSEAFYKYLVTDDIEKASEACSADDVPDFELNSWINQVQNINYNYILSLGHNMRG